MYESQRGLSENIHLKTAIYATVVSAYPLGIITRYSVFFNYPDPPEGNQGYYN